jgi:hypothetical protein
MKHTSLAHYANTAHTCCQMSKFDATIIMFMHLLLNIDKGNKVKCQSIQLAHKLCTAVIGICAIKIQ